MNRRAGERGGLLLVSLWTVTLLSIFALAAGYKAWGEARLTARQIDRMKENRLCTAAVEISKSVLAQSAVPGLQLWNNPSAFKDVELPEGQMALLRDETDHRGEAIRYYGLEDEEGRINLNRAPLYVLEALPGMTREAAAAIVDWRDPDSKTTTGGAEEDYYSALESPYRCKNGPLESVQELMMIKGVTQQIYEGLRPTVTVYGNGAVNINTAREQSLESLGLSLQTVDAIARYREGVDGLPYTDDDRVFSNVNEIAARLKAVQPVSEDQSKKIQALAAANLLGVASKHYRIRLEIYGRAGSVSARFEGVLGMAPGAAGGVVRQWERL